MRMLCCPLRSPASFSSRLPGGIRKSVIEVAAWSWSSFRSAVFWMSNGYSGALKPSKMVCVALDLKLVITCPYYRQTIVVAMFQIERSPFGCCEDRLTPRATRLSLTASLSRWRYRSRRMCDRSGTTLYDSRVSQNKSLYTSRVQIRKCLPTLHTNIYHP